ncbi:MAG: DNA mismatch repair endonuclease MutL, partial [Spirochaetales bacterium]|nr:DNA mismatch repair endonuclease MutL [Spirochaetales bacterium]
MRIKQLPESVYSRIAAGEVIDKPAAVVRELVDNAIDAGAKNITVKTINGGIDSIVVDDDGCGIHKDDLLLALTEHATSKIFDVDDIYNVTTMGFRGEALNSIKTVAHLTITTNTDESGLSAGSSINNEDYKVKSVPFKKGTMITVTDLFYNLPARRKFLKSKITELNNVKKVLRDKALANLNISFRFFHDGKLVFATKGDGDFAAAFHSVTPNAADNGAEIHINTFTERINDDLSFTIYYSSPDVFFSSRKYQTLFVNKRPVSVPFYYSVIDTAVREYISPGRHAMICTFIDINPSQIDVNIHPAKKEINFADSAFVSAQLCRAIKLAMSQMLSRRISLDGGLAADQQPYIADKPFSVHLFETDQFDSFRQNGAAPSDSSDYIDFIERSQSMPSEDFSDVCQNIGDDYRIVGRIFNNYILVEKDNKMLIIDQHAASESIIYRKKLKNYEESHSVEQLIIPLTAELTDWTDKTEQRIELLNQNGFDIERREGTTIVIRSVPHVLLLRKNNDVVTNLIVSFLQKEIDPDKSIIDQILIEASCKEAIKKGDYINLLEMTEIVQQYFAYGITNCPHGRPAH